MTGEQSADVKDASTAIAPAPLLITLADVANEPRVSTRQVHRLLIIGKDVSR